MIGTSEIKIENLGVKFLDGWTHWYLHQHLEVTSDAAKHPMQNTILQIRSQTDANALARQKGFNNTGGVIFSSTSTWESKAQDPLQM